MTGTSLDEAQQKVALLELLGRGRDALLWKLDGLDEYDLRRPLVPTGTNLLGLVKHTASVEADYLGVVFGRPFPETLAWMADDAEVNADMWATPDQSTADLVAFYHRVAAHSAGTLDALPLSATGHVPWWPPEREHPTLHRVLVYVIAETSRHAGHADIVRELIDGSAGLLASVTNLPEGDAAWWSTYWDRVEAAARAAAGK